MTENLHFCLLMSFRNKVGISLLSLSLPLRELSCYSITLCEVEVSQIKYRLPNQIEFQMNNEYFLFSVSISQMLHGPY